MGIHAADRSKGCFVNAAEGCAVYKDLNKR